MSRTRTTPAVLAAVVSVLAAGTGAPAAQKPPPLPRVHEALEQYAARPGDELPRRLTRHKDVGQFLRSYAAEAGRWISRAGPEDRPLRQRVAAALAMELVAASLDGALSGYGTAKPLIEWSCALLSGTRPSEFERMFHLASIATLQGAADWSMFSVIEGPYKRTGHFDHALARFPDDDHLKLARVLARHELRVISTVPLTPFDVLPHLPRPRTAEADMARLNETFDLLTELDGTTVGDETRLRRGVLHLLTGRIPVASGDFGETVTSPIPFVAYLSNLLLGSIYYNSGDTDAAVGRYAKAWHLVPATAARLGLAAALLKQGQTRDAADLAAPLPAPDPGSDERPEDPWRLYGLGLFHWLPQFLAGMRAELR